MNKLQKLAHKFAQQLANPVPVDSSLNEAQQNLPTDTGPSPFDKLLEQLKSKQVADKHLDQLQAEQYWLLPNGVIDLALATILDNKPMPNSLQVIYQDLQNAKFNRQKYLQDENGRVINDPRYISRIQTALVANNVHIGTWGIKKDGVDGKWGPDSSAGLQGFQLEKGLDVNGVLTPETRVALGLLHQ